MQTLSQPDHQKSIVYSRFLSARTCAWLVVLPLLLATGVRSLALESDDLDKAIGDLVKLVDQARAPGASQSAVGTAAPATPEGVASRPKEIPPPPLEVLFKDMWGADWDSQNASDLKFYRENPGDDHGFVQIYIRQFRRGSRSVNFEDLEKGNWSNSIVGGVIHLTVVSQKLGQSDFELDPKAASLKLTASPSNAFPALLQKRVLPDGEVGPAGKAVFTK